MAEAPETITEDTKFRMNILKFIYKVCKKEWASYLLKDTEIFPKIPSIYFTSNICKAMLFLMSEASDTGKPQHEIGSEEYINYYHYVLMEYEPHEFLKFIAWYGRKSAVENSAKDYVTVRDDVQKLVDCIFYDEQMWVDLDNYARLYVRDEECKPRRVRSEDIDSSVKSEEEFVLSAMEHMFNLHYVDIPDEIRDRLHILREWCSITRGFTEKVGRAMTVLLINQYELKEYLEWGGLEEIFFERICNKYTERDLLEFCVCIFQKAVKDYNKSCFYYLAPVKAEKTMMYFFKDLKLKGWFHSFKQIQAAADYILDQEEMKIEELTGTKLASDSKKDVKTRAEELQAKLDELIKNDGRVTVELREEIEADFNKSLELSDEFKKSVHEETTKRKSSEYTNEREDSFRKYFRQKYGTEQAKIPDYSKAGPSTKSINNKESNGTTKQLEKENNKTSSTEYRTSSSDQSYENPAYSGKQDTVCNNEESNVESSKSILESSQEQKCKCVSECACCKCALT